MNSGKLLFHPSLSVVSHDQIKSRFLYMEYLRHISPQNNTSYTEREVYLHVIALYVMIESSKYAAVHCISLYDAR